MKRKADAISGVCIVRARKSPWIETQRNTHVIEPFRSGLVRARGLKQTIEFRKYSPLPSGLVRARGLKQKKTTRQAWDKKSGLVRARGLK